MTPADRLRLMSALYQADTGKTLDVDDPVSTQDFADWTKSRALECALARLDAVTQEFDSLTSTTAEWRYHARIGAAVASFFRGTELEKLEDPTFCIGREGTAYSVSAQAGEGTDQFEGGAQSGDLAIAVTDAVEAFRKNRLRKVN